MRKFGLRICHAPVQMHTTSTSSTERKLIRWKMDKFRTVFATKLRNYCHHAWVRVSGYWSPRIVWLSQNFYSKRRLYSNRLISPFVMRWWHNLNNRLLHVTSYLGIQKKLLKGVRNYRYWWTHESCMHQRGVPHELKRFHNGNLINKYKGCFINSIQSRIPITYRANNKGGWLSCVRG